MGGDVFAYTGPEECEAEPDRQENYAGVGSGDAPLEAGARVEPTSLQHLLTLKASTSRLRGMHARQAQGGTAFSGRF